MRIGLVTGEYPPMIGGVGAYTHILAQVLSDQGNTVIVFSAQRAQIQDGIPVTNIIHHWNLASLGAIRRWAGEQQLDIVNLQFQTAAFGLSPWIHFLPEALGRIPMVTTFHDLRFPYLFPKAGKLREWIVKRLAKQSDGVIVTNQEDQQRLNHLNKVTLIPIGSNIRKALPADFDAQAYRTRAGAQADDFLISYFGLWNRSKGIEVLLEAIANLRQKRVPVRLVMIGDVGTSDPTNATYAAEIRHLIEKHDLKKVVQEMGHLEEAEVGEYLSASDAVVLPFLDGASYRRGSLMAAIQYQTAIVTTQPQVPIAAFQDGENMLLVKPGDAAELEAVLARLYHDLPLRNRLKDGAGKLAQHFEWAQIARETTAYFGRIIEGM